MLLLEQGEEMGVISKILGDGTLATTADIYAHLTPGMSQRAAERLDVVLRPRSRHWRARARVGMAVGTDPNQEARRGDRRASFVRGTLVSRGRFELPTK